MEHNVNQRNSSRQTDLMIACKTGNAPDVRVILEWRDDDGKRVDISARDEKGQTALSFAKQSNNAEIVEMIEQNLFLRAVENGDTETVKTYLTQEESNFEQLDSRSDSNFLIAHHDRKSEQMEMQSHEDDLTEGPPPKRVKGGIETEFTSKDSITRSVWLEAVNIAHKKCLYEMLNLLFNDDRFIHGFNEDGQTIFHQVVTEYVKADIFTGKIKTLEILLKSGKLSAEVSNLQIDTISEIVHKIKPTDYWKIYHLLRIFLQSGIALNDKNKHGETLLMLACKNKRFDIVRSLLHLASRDFIPDIDALDNSGETALMKAKRNNDSKIVAALFLLKLMSAAKDENEDAMLTDGHFLLGFNEDELTNFYNVVAKYFEDNMVPGKIKKIGILLKSWKCNASVMNLKNETIFEIICKIKPEYHCKIDNLLLILLQNGIDLNSRNENGETFLMLALKNKRVDIGRSLLDLASILASHGFVIDIDVVDNSDKTALMKAKQDRDSETVAALLILKLIYALEDKNEHVIRSVLDEFNNISAISVKSWSSDQLDYDCPLEDPEEKYDILLEAMYKAMENNTKYSEEIVKLLVDCDILLSQEISWYQLINRRKVDNEKKLSLIELLLKSGKINANDRDENGRTALHCTREKKLISLLIRYGADVNGKDNEGKTHIMPISGNNQTGNGSCPVLWTLLEEAGRLVNLDAVDCNGRTALMHAVMLNHSYHVELLLNAGASVNLSDHLGFTALHYVLYGKLSQYLLFPRNSEELKKIKEMASCDDSLWGKKWRDKWEEERMKIAEMLLQRPDIDVNLLSIQGFSPLDIAEARNKNLPSSIKDDLIKKGADLNFFHQTELQSTSEFHLDFICELILKQLDQLQYKPDTENVCLFKEKWLALVDTFKELKVSSKDQQGRTALHLLAISSYRLDIKHGGHIRDLAKSIVDELISFGCSVNDTDAFGRTPLHYAKELLWKLLISEGANESKEDNDGNIAIEIKSLHYSDEISRKSSTESYDIASEVKDRNHEIYLLRFMNNREMEINVQRIDYQDRASDSTDNDSDTEEMEAYIDSKVNDNEEAPEIYFQDAAEFRHEEPDIKLLWKDGMYAYRHPLFKKITKEVIDLMDAIAKEVERLDPRFEIKVEFVGSSNEGTKLDEPDEFDFNFVLTKISELCEVSQSPELPTGYVRLMQNSIKVCKTSDFDSFFAEDGTLNTAKLNLQFATILSNTRANIERQQRFEWISKYPIECDHIFGEIKKVFTIEMIRPLNFSTVKYISIDIVPCIHIDGWWPDEAISNVSDEIKKFGCNLIFDGPHKLYPWVPYSESCTRISFAIADSEMIKQSCDNAREAYMIGKTMAKYVSVSKYILKNCVLYCIEALSPSSEKALQLGLSLEEMRSKFHQMDRFLWLKCLLKCHLEFVSQDFCPCYFLPKFSNYSVNLFQEGEHYLKQYSFDWIADRPSLFPMSCKEACALYRCASNDISDSSYQLPAPDLLWERFDRNQLIASLFEMAYK